jgi:uncharacterized protein YjiS (DUF1127 family)
MAQATTIRTWHRPAKSLTHRLAGRLHDAWAAFLAYRIERETVRLLQSLDNRTLKDIGLHRSEIESLAHNPASERRIGMCA